MAPRIHSFVNIHDCAPVEGSTLGFRVGVRGGNTIMKTKNSKKGNGDEQMDVRALAALAAEAGKQADTARKQARLAKAKFKEARKLFKLAKRAARLARKEAKAAAKVLKARTRKPARRSGAKRHAAKRKPAARKRRVAPAKAQSPAAMPPPSPVNSGANITVGVGSDGVQP